MQEEFTADTLQELLSKGIIQELLWLDETTSTNDIALQQASVHQKQSTLIVAPLQTSGRGRGENTWLASSGALTFSLMLNIAQLQVPLIDLPCHSLRMALAIHSVCQGFLPPASALKLKWPNDIYLNGKKVGGILTEHTSGQLIIGVGINVNNHLQQYPEDIQQKAITLQEVADCELPRQEILKQILIEFAPCYLTDFAANIQTPLSQLWEPHSLLKDKQVTLQLPHEIISGKCLGISDTGAIMLQTAAGICPYYAGVVQSFE